MGYAKLIIVLAALPGILLSYKVYKLDKIESEPMNLVIKLFIFGVLSTIPASIIEAILSIISGSALKPGTITYNFIYFFFCVALVEELCKYFALKIGSWKNPAFDYVFDGIVYSVVTACGFAILENILYGFLFGFQTLFLRAITAIPGHIIFGIFMGHFYGLAKQAEARGGKNKGYYKFLAILVPVLIHGAYDFIVSNESVLCALIFVAFVIVLDIVAFIKVRNYSKVDEHI